MVCAVVDAVPGDDRVDRVGGRHVQVALRVAVVVDCPLALLSLAFLGPRLHAGTGDTGHPLEAILCLLCVRMDSRVSTCSVCGQTLKLK